MIAEVRCVLLVEDSDEDAELTIAALDEHRVLNDVVRARDGVEALDYLYRRNGFAGRPPADPGLVLLDLKMPRVNGLEVLRHVKADPALRNIPVVILTSSREECDLVESYGLGANAYVVKPVGFPEFVDAVRHIGGFWIMTNEPPPRPPQQPR